MTTSPLCIYHANCVDGFAAAWVVRKAFHGVVDFHPGIYGEPFAAWKTRHQREASAEQLAAFAAAQKAHAQRD